MTDDDVDLELAAAGSGSKPPQVADYDIGFGRPPKKRRFKKGQSGNPKGRPKVEPINLLFSFKEMLDESLRSRNDKAVSKRELMMRNLFAQAAACNQRAFSRFLKLAKRAGLMKELSNPSTEPVSAELRVFTDQDMDEMTNGWWSRQRKKNT